jgi:aryl-alcohol dehydrogenase-like predicted oxidoreductase
MASMFQVGSSTLNRMGFGAMQLPGPGVWGPPRDRDEAIAVLKRAVEAGVNHIDTAQYYGPDVANELIHSALHPYPEDLRIVTKLGGRRGDDASWLPAASPDELRQGVEDNLRSLGLDTIFLVNIRILGADMPESDLPIEESVGVLSELRDQGKIELIGVSNVTPEHVTKAAAVTEIACVQNHYNLVERGDDRLLEMCESEDMAFVPFFPLGSAFGAGASPLESEVVQRIAEAHDSTPAQIALAGLLAKSPNILLIPGTGTLAHLEENLAAAQIELTADEVAELDAL